MQKGVKARNTTRRGYPIERKSARVIHGDVYDNNDLSDYRDEGEYKLTTQAVEKFIEGRTKVRDIWEAILAQDQVREPVRSHTICRACATEGARVGISQETGDARSDREQLREFDVIYQIDGREGDVCGVGLV